MGRTAISRDTVAMQMCRETFDTARAEGSRFAHRTSSARLPTMSAWRLACNERPSGTMECSAETQIGLRRCAISAFKARPFQNGQVVVGSQCGLPVVADEWVLRHWAEFRGSAAADGPRDRTASNRPAGENKNKSS